MNFNVNKRQSQDGAATGTGDKEPTKKKIMFYKSEQSPSIAIASLDDSNINSPENNEFDDKALSKADVENLIQFDQSDIAMTEKHILIRKDDVVEMEPQKHNSPTAEQQKIINVGNSLTKMDHRIIRVFAGAGTGKTTTLQFLAEQLLKREHTILYLVYNKPAQIEADRRFKNRNLVCKTIHAAALAYTDYGFKITPIDDQVLIKQIIEHYHIEITQYISIKPQKKKSIPKLVDLVGFWIFKTLEAFYRSDRPYADLDNKYLTYYTCQKNHLEKLGFEYTSFYVDKVKEIWLSMWSENSDFGTTHDSYVKMSQLGNLRIPQFTCILFDESQDTSACQLDLFCSQQVSAPMDGVKKSVVVVGKNSFLYF
jgi:hypothetical protein